MTVKDRKDRIKRCIIVLSSGMPAMHLEGWVYSGKVVINDKNDKKEKRQYIIWLWKNHIEIQYP